MNLFLYFLLIPIIFSFLQSETVFQFKPFNKKRYQESSKQIIKHQKILYSNSELLINGEYTKSITVPLVDQGIHVTDSLFSNCISNNLNGGAISCYVTKRSFYKPIFTIESSTFHECYALSFGAKGGSLYIEGYSLFTQNNCFLSCSASFGVFCHYMIQPKFECYINQSTFHTNSKPGIGHGSVIASSDHLIAVDNNFTNIKIGGDGSGFITTVSEKYCISRNIFKNHEGKSVIFIDTIPLYYIFQLLNFISDIEQGNGIISISNNFMLSKCFFHNSGPVLINSEKGKTFLYQCIFDSFQKSSNSIFKGSVENKKPSYEDNDDRIRFGINNHLDTDFCKSESNENFIEIFTPTKTPIFHRFSPNPADIVILACIGVLFIFLIFTLTYFLWYCICSKPNLKSSIKYLKTKDADKYIDNFMSYSGNEEEEEEVNDGYSDPFYDVDEEDQSNRKKSKKAKKKKADEDEEFDDGYSDPLFDFEVENEDDKKRNKKKAKTKTKTKKNQNKKNKKSKKKKADEDEEFDDGYSDPLFDFEEENVDDKKKNKKKKNQSKKKKDKKKDSKKKKNQIDDVDAEEPEKTSKSNKKKKNKKELSEDEIDDGLNHNSDQLPELIGDSSTKEDMQVVPESEIELDPEPEMDPKSADEGEPEP